MLTPTLTDKNFHDEVRESTQTVIVLFSGDWCQPCKRFKPTFETMSERMPDLKFMICDIEQAQEIASDLSIRSVPTLTIFVGGMIHEVHVGTMQLSELREWITDNI